MAKRLEVDQLFLIFDRLIKAAQSGDVPASKLVLFYWIGKKPLFEDEQATAAPIQIFNILSDSAHLQRAVELARALANGRVEQSGRHQDDPTPGGGGTPASPNLIENLGKISKKFTSGTTSVGGSISQGETSETTIGGRSSSVTSSVDSMSGGGGDLMSLLEGSSELGMVERSIAESSGSLLERLRVAAARSPVRKVIESRVVESGKVSEVAPLAESAGVEEGSESGRSLEDLMGDVEEVVGEVGKGSGKSTSSESVNPETEIPMKRKAGRPKGSKNRVKVEGEKVKRRRRRRGRKKKLG